MGIPHGLIGKENADGQKHKSGQPHAGKRGQGIFFGKFFAGGAGKIKYHEEDDGKDQWGAQSAFADNGTQRGADQEQNQTGK